MGAHNGSSQGALRELVAVAGIVGDDYVIGRCPALPCNYDEKDEKNDTINVGWRCRRCESNDECEEAMPVLHGMEGRDKDVGR